jgi:hypothetical protein
MLIFLPNLIWQVQHSFISLDFLGSIHERDIRIGRTQGYLTDQLWMCTNLVTIPLWVAGLFFYFATPAGKRYRPLGWMFAVPFGLMLITQGRGYYLTPAYPLLIAAGAVWGEQWLATLPAGQDRLVQGITWSLLAVGGVLIGALALPIAPINSPWWEVASGINNDLKEEIGWPELTETVAGIYAALPDQERSQAGILTGNFGEAGAINLYGPSYGLPEAISGINSYWLRGFGDPPPQILIVLGFTFDDAEQFLGTCDLAGHVTNRYGVKNEETKDHPDIFVCRQLHEPLPELWKHFRWFG